MLAEDAVRWRFVEGRICTDRNFQIRSAIANYYTKNPKAKTTDLGGTGAAMPKVEVETVMEGGQAQAATA